MEITIIAFGIAKDIIGQQEMSFVVEAPHSVLKLKNQLFEQYPDFVNVQSIKVAVNQTYAKDDQILASNDEIVLIPPVSGG